MANHPKSYGARAAAPPHRATSKPNAAPPHVGSNPDDAFDYDNIPRSSIIDFFLLVYIVLAYLLIIGVVVVVVVVVVVFVVSLSMSGFRSPVFSVTSVAISAFNLSSPSASTPLLSSYFDLTLSVHNPNKMIAFDYDHVAVSVAYGGKILAETKLPPFSLEKGTSTALRATLAAKEECVGGEVARGISSDWASSGAVGFEVMMESSVAFWTWWNSNCDPLRVHCKDVRIAFANETATAGSMAGPPKECEAEEYDDSTHRWYLAN